MNSITFLFLGLAGALAILNWIAVASTNKILEYVSKPSATIAFLLTAVFLDVNHSSSWWLRLAALVFCLAGDVFLMLPRNAFIPGLASFAVGQILFTASFLAAGIEMPLLLVGLIVLVPMAFVLARRFLGALRHRGMNELVVPVSVYLVVISAMAVMSIASGSWLAVAGAVIFVVSDSLIAETRFVQPKQWHSVGIMVTYHLALAGLTLSLV